LSGRFPYVKRNSYPHMIGEDLIIWNRFIDRFPGRFDSVDYDWRVGQGMDLQESWEDTIKRMATMITQKRIDVLGWNGEIPTIIEVKKNVSISTLGQVLGYQILFVHDFPHIHKPEILVVCGSLSIDDSTVLGAYSIPVEVV